MFRVDNPSKHGVVLSSYGWSGGALRQVSEILSPTGLEVVGTHKINGPPKEEDHQKIIELRNQLVEKIKG